MHDSAYESVSACRGCGQGGLRTLLALGRVPLANALLTHPPAPDKPEPRFPLTLAFCPACSLVQILETVDPDVLFGHYLYFSSFSRTMLDHAARAAEALIAARRLTPASLVVELASNDGYLLKNFLQRGIGVLGIEPARNIAAVAQAAGIPTRAVFFGRDTAEALAAEGIRADAVLGNNVLAHVADLNGFVAGAARLLKPDGCVVFEAPYVGDMIDNVEFDTIYHEHLCYFSLHALRHLFRRHGLELTDVQRLPIHGGSLRVAGEPAGTAPVSDRVRTLLALEERRGMTTLAFYERFAERVQTLCRDLRAELDRRLKAGQSLAAYGASAKGSTLMNVAGIGTSHLAFVADVSTAKQGKLTPGNHLPIVPPAALTTGHAGAPRPDAVLMLAWNLTAEIASQQAAYLDAGGEFIIPIPKVSAFRAADLPAVPVETSP